MTKRTYTSTMRCPRCGHDYIVEHDIKGPPALKCGECMSRDAVVAELEILSVEVQP